MATTEMPLYMRREEFDPAPDLAAIRDAEGVTRVRMPYGEEAWLVTRFDDVRAVLGDWRRFSNARAGARQLMAGGDAKEAAARRAGQMLLFDPPDHTRLRRMLTPEFTVRRIRRLQPRIQEIVDDHLDAMERQGAPADLVQAFALPVPSLVICELLGVPYADREGFQRRSGRLLDLALPMEERRAAQLESRAYMSELVTRAQAAPGDDLIGMLIREHGDELSHDELVGIAHLLLLAGHETTSNMLGLGTLALLRHPDQLARLRAEPSLVEPAVEELMRWLSIVHSGTSKVTTEDVEIAGVRIPEGAIVLCALPAANRDPEVAESPDRLDVTRAATAHAAFGHGLHHCLGAPLARMEMRTAFPALFARFPGLRETGTPPEFRATSFIYGLTGFEVAW